MTITRRTAIAASALAVVGLAVPGAALAATTPAAAPAAVTVSTSPTLRLGSTGKAVVELQDRLRSSGYTALVTGYFGTMTRDAVIAFQKEHGLTRDGIVGARTWAVLRDTGALPTQAVHPTISLGARGDAVKELQGMLNSTHSVPSVRVDGMFGAGTRASVIAFQRQVRIPADGIVGPRTWSMLTSASAY